MRTPETTGYRGVLPPGEPTAAPLAVLAWNRIAFGPGQGDIADFEALGGDDVSRLTALVDLQLDPESIDDSDADQKVNAAGFTTLNKSLTRLWIDHARNATTWDEKTQPIYEVSIARFPRAVHSRRQLFEVMVDFWHDHFSVFGWRKHEGATWVHYDRDVIRPNALGNFRDFLEAVGKSTPMLIFLDNFVSSEDGPNENYARELMELHSLGEENYYGTASRDQVPVDSNGKQLGFVDEDVFNVARAFSGWGLDGDPWWDLEGGNGTHIYRSDWHDIGEKNVLGHILPPGQHQDDGLDVFDILASHPGTAQYVSRKLCRRFIGDVPPETVVDAAAQTFLANTSASDQIAQVVRTILLSQEFRDSWGGKIKRPFELVVSAMRSVNSQFPFVLGDPESEDFDWRFSLGGHYPFSWESPDGYPDFIEDWLSTSPKVMTWQLTNWLMDRPSGLDPFRIQILNRTPSDLRSANALVDYWIDRILGREMSTGDRQEIVDFMAQGADPDDDLPIDTDADTTSRLQSMVGLIFMSPEFQWR